MAGFAVGKLECVMPFLVGHASDGGMFLDAHGCADDGLARGRVADGALDGALRHKVKAETQNQSQKDKEAKLFVNHLIFS